jgi:hypothetical protein
MRHLLFPEIHIAILYFFEAGKKLKTTIKMIGTIIDTLLLTLYLSVRGPSSFVLTTTLLSYISTPIVSLLAHVHAAHPQYINIDTLVVPLLIYLLYRASTLFSQPWLWAICYYACVNTVLEFPKWRARNLRNICGLEEWLGPHWVFGLTEMCRGWRDGLIARGHVWTYLWESMVMFWDEKMLEHPGWKMLEVPGTAVGWFWWLVVRAFP